MASYTHLRPLFEALGGRQREFQWLVTSWECAAPHNPAGFPFDEEMPPRVLSGSQITALADGENPQFVWGVLTALDPRRRIDVTTLEAEPWADGNPAVWNPDDGPQFPGAVLEIVCFDSGCTIITSADEDVHRRIRAYFPEAMPMPPLGGLPPMYGPRTPHHPG
jgi:hypothetical protein